MCDERISEDDPLAGLPCRFTLRSGDVEVRVLDCPLKCGHPGYWIDVSTYHNTDDRPIPMALLREMWLDETIALLTEAKEFIGRIDPPCTDCANVEL